MSFKHSKGFKYFKNLIIGIGASIVMIGALAKLESWEGAGIYLTLGLSIEAFIFLFLGIIGPDKDYYWEKLYPGLDRFAAKINPLTEGEVEGQTPGINGVVLEQQLGGVLTELQTMSKSLSSLKALQEIDLSGTSDQLKTMNNFYTKINEAMADIGDSLEDTKQFKDQLSVLNKNLGSLNSVYGNVLSAMSNIRNDG